ncbi:MAG: DNA polymerase III subunit beta [Bacilli bacterium]
MKFNCNQQVLSKALNTVSKAVTTRTTIPILKGILIETKENQITFSASDLDISIEKTIEANVDIKGSTVVSAKLFTDIIKKLPNENIFVELIDDNNLLIKTAHSEFTIVGQSSDEFPNIGEMSEVKTRMLFDKEIFKSMIKKTFFSSSIDDSKGIITGVLLEIEENNFNMIALDGFRMAICRESMKNEKVGNIIIQGKTLGEILKILTESEDESDIEILIGDKKALILIENTKISITLMNGEFVNYENILPKECSTKIILNKSDFLIGIERASLLAKEGKNNLIKCSIEENLLTINSRSEEGMVKEDIIIEKTGSDVEIGFNSKYISEALKAIDDENISIEFNTAVTPCLIKPIEGNNYEYLILPVRISSN